jgi:succinate dehydrogenase (ubiquinone) cytochrome b560 subunit
VSLALSPIDRSSNPTNQITDTARHDTIYASSIPTCRSIQTESLTPQENLALLNAQRTVRPNSPHLSIYQPQVCTGVISLEQRVEAHELTSIYS